MASVLYGEFNLIEGSERLICLTSALNLEDCDKSSLGVYDLHPFVDDYSRLHRHVRELKKIVCGYGLDKPLFDETLMKKMRVLAKQLVLHSDAAAAYCALKSQLFLEENDFFDEVLSRMECRIRSCTSDAESERLLLAMFRLRSIYDIYL